MRRHQMKSIEIRRLKPQTVLGHFRGQRWGRRNVLLDHDTLRSIAFMKLLLIKRLRATEAIFQGYTIHLDG
jgi:hypothetical protein